MAYSPSSALLRRSPRARAVPRLEPLESRTLLTAQRATPGLADFASLQAVPETFDSSSILVRFRPGARDQVCAEIMPGTRIGNELGLVSELHLVHLAAGVSVGSALAAYQASSLVAYAEPNFSLRASSTIPNDPQFEDQWALENQEHGGREIVPHINAPPAWDYGTGSLAQIVAVVDTGIDYDHPDLYGNIWLNQAEIPTTRRANLVDTDGDGLITFWDLNESVNQGPGKITDQNGDGRISGADILQPISGDLGGWADGVDQGGNGKIDDLVGWNFVGDNRSPVDTNGHGTHVAGIIGAIGDNGVGIAGINWRVQMMALKIGEGEELNLVAAVQAIAYAVANGAVVSNHSYTTTERPKALEDAMATAGEAGHIVVAAAGNDGLDLDTAPVYPASFSLDNVIAVAATDNSDRLAEFSNYGETTVHLGAPGVNILSTSLNGGFEPRSGTSFAAAHVTGAIAWVRDILPELSSLELIDVILVGTELIESMSGVTITGGRLSLYQTLVGYGVIPINEGGSSPGLGGGSDGNNDGEDFAANASEDLIAASLTLELGSETDPPTVEQAEGSFLPEGPIAFDLWDVIIPAETADGDQVASGVLDTPWEDSWVFGVIPIEMI